MSIKNRLTRIEEHSYKPRESGIIPEIHFYCIEGGKVIGDLTDTEKQDIENRIKRGENIPLIT